MRNYKKKGLHTEPSKAGVQNMPKDYAEKHREKDPEGNGLAEIIPMMKKGFERAKRTSAWSPEELKSEVEDFFQYCADNSVKPSKSALQLWLGLSRPQYYSWATERAKYGEISDIIAWANNVMETQYIDRLESYPTGNTFLLKTSFGYRDTQDINITSEVSSDEVKDMIAKLGLDKE